MVGLAPAKVRVHWELCLVCGRRRLLQHGIKARATMLMLYYCFLNSLLLDPNRHAFLVFLLPASGHYWNKLACHKTEPFSALLAWPSTSPPSTEFALNFCCCLHPWAKAKRKASMRGLLLLFLHITSKQTKGQKGFQNFFFPIWTEDFGKSWHLESLTAEEMEKVELIKNFAKVREWELALHHEPFAPPVDLKRRLHQLIWKFFLILSFEVLDVSKEEELRKSDNG